ncbi:MAG: fumarate reductase/succinate dehydrogenase flavoprotein domain protein [Aeromicrobium sp.]|nr:fumarate reductase/succinate dehydrogenase flavoprotein domain protein [Aeromicrobium sp.]
MTDPRSTLSKDQRPGLALPEPIAIGDATSQEHVDVVVVGFGIAGGCAALEAARAGACVLLLERAAVHGGTTSMAGGHFYLGGGTPVQVATGQQDSVEEMYKYLVATSKAPEHDKILAYCESSVEHFAWLETLGFEFERSYYPHKAVIQPETQGLMYTGNEKLWPYRDMAVPAPRGHKIPVPGDTQGAKVVMDLLRDRCEEAGVEVRYETGVTNLIVDGDRVAGVRWRRFGEHGDVTSGAVVIAAGGFVGNADMVQEFTPELGSKLITLGSTYDDGLGIRLGQSVGAETCHMDESFITAPFYPPSSHMFGIIVNKHGKRFVAEDSYHARTGYFTMKQPDSVAYLIVDSAHVQEPTMPLTPLIDGYDTVAEMETGLSLPVGSLAETLERYTADARAGHDTEFMKHPDWLVALDNGPWAAFDLSLGKALYSGFTMGGLSTTVDAEVQRPDGSVVRGLYAAGACATNIAVDGAGYCSGTQLGEGSYFGRRAGRAAATVTIDLNTRG